MGAVFVFKGGILMKLIIAEKPSVAFALAKALNIKGGKDGYIENNEFVISWCGGAFGSPCGAVRL